MSLKRRVAVGLSGGVDSAAALFFLKEQGYECIGVHLRLADLEEKEAQRQIQDAEAVAQNMDIPFFVLDCRKEFCEQVTDYFIREYLNGRTPNPCIVCNETIRWKKLIEFADQNGIEWIATGHYARIKKDNGKTVLSKPKDEKKDQTYFLYRIKEEMLRRTLFPLGEYQKSEVRKILEREGIFVAQKADSQEICFLPEGSRAKWFLKPCRFSSVSETERQKGCAPGEIVDLSGRVLGYHHGISFYTTGQRKGLGISAREPLYVQKIDRENCRIVLGPKEQQYVTEIIIGQATLKATVWKEQTGYVRVRSNGELVPCTVCPMEEREGYWRFVLKQPVWKPGVGQSAVFYQEDNVVFGGIIEFV